MFQSMDDLTKIIVREQHCETTVFPHLAALTKTDYGVSLGLPATYPCGKLNADGTPKEKRLQDVIHKGAWRKFLRTLTPPGSPDGLSIIHFGLTAIATHHTRFFMETYALRSKDYQSLPYESKWVLFNGCRANAMWEGFDEKIILQERGYKAFACPWLYDLLVSARGIKREMDATYRRVNVATWKQRNTGSDASRERGKAIAALLIEEAKERYQAQLQQLAHDLPTLPPLPPGIPPFALLEDLPRDLGTPPEEEGDMHHAG